MIKLIVLALGLVVGFGAGVYWGVHHPVEAQKLAAEEERRVLEAKKQVAEAFKKRLDGIISSSPKPGTSDASFLPSATGSPPSDAKLLDLRRDTEREIEEMDKQL